MLHFGTSKPLREWIEPGTLRAKAGKTGRLEIVHDSECG